MTTVHWLFERDVFDHYRDEYLAAAQRLGHQIKLTPVAGFGYGWDETRRSREALFPRGSCVLFHGSIGLAEELLEHAPWEPTVLCNWQHLECTTYYCHFGKYLLNDQYVMLPFGELGRRRQWLFDTVGESGKFFARPNSCRKSFTGQLVSRETFDHDMEIMGFYDIPPDLLVCVSPRKQITCEWRTVIVDRQVVTGSQYKLHGKLESVAGVPVEVQRFAETLANEPWQPDRAWTADIAKTVDGDLRLLEIGSVSCSDLYACDKTAFVQALSSLAVDLHAADLDKETQG